MQETRISTILLCSFLFVSGPCVSCSQSEKQDNIQTKSAEKQMNAVFSADYYPLKKGMEWQYGLVIEGGMYDKSKGGLTASIISDSYYFGKIKTIPIRLQETGQIDFVIKDKTGIYLYAKQKSTDPEPQILEEKIVYSFKYPLDIGTSWDKTLTSWLLSENHEVEVKCEIDKTNETIITSAGTFEGCIRIKCNGENS